MPMTFLFSRRFPTAGRVVVRAQKPFTQGIRPATRRAQQIFSEQDAEKGRDSFNIRQLDAQGHFDGFE